MLPDTDINEFDLPAQQKYIANVAIITGVDRSQVNLRVSVASVRVRTFVLTSTAEEAYIVENSLRAACDPSGQGQLGECDMGTIMTIPFALYPPPARQPPTSPVVLPPRSDGGLSTGAIVGVSIAVVIFVLAAAAAAAYRVCKGRRPNLIVKAVKAHATKAADLEATWAQPSLFKGSDTRTANSGSARKMPRPSTRRIPRGSSGSRHVAIEDVEWSR